MKTKILFVLVMLSLAGCATVPHPDSAKEPIRSAYLPVSKNGVITVSSGHGPIWAADKYAIGFFASR